MMYSPATAPCWSSRPQVRNTLERPRSVSFGLVEAGLMAITLPSAYCSEAGIETPELK